MLFAWLNVSLRRFNSLGRALKQNQAKIGGELMLFMCQFHEPGFHLGGWHFLLGNVREDSIESIIKAQVTLSSDGCDTSPRSLDGARRCESLQNR